MNGRIVKLEIEEENKIYLNINLKKDINLDYKILNHEKLFKLTQ